MELSPIVEAIGDDLRRAGAVGTEETRRIADLLVTSVEASLGLRVIEALQEAARELSDSFPGAQVEVRMQGRDPVLTLSLSSPARSAGGAEGEPGASYGEDELARLTLRLPESLKNQVERAAWRAGTSINSWIVSAVARALDAPAGFGFPPASSRRLPRRMTGYVQG
jgi:hypothetical protein